MIKRHLKELLIVFSLVTIVLCGFLYKFSKTINSSKINFVQQQNYDSPFFFLNEYNYNVEYDTVNTSNYKKSIVSDWSEFLKGKISKNDLSSLLFDNDSNRNVREKYKDIIDIKVANFLEFLYYIKEIEKISTSKEFSWHYEKDHILNVEDSLIYKIENKYKNSKDVFLKNRYWFQTIKSKFYIHDKNLVSFFEKTKNDAPENLLYYRAMNYLSGFYAQKKDYVKSNFLSSVIFENCPEMRSIIIKNFHPQNDSDFNLSLNLAKTKNEKCSLWILYGFYADEEIAIEEIYKLNPRNKHLEYLLMKFVNNYEKRLFKLSEESGILNKEVVKKNNRITFLIKQIANNKNTNNPSKWFLASAYICILNGEHNAANNLLENVKEDGVLNNEIRALKLINNMCKNDKISSEEKSEIDWFLSLKSNNKDLELRYKKTFKWIEKQKINYN